MLFYDSVMTHTDAVNLITCVDEMCAPNSKLYNTVSVNFGILGN